MTEHRDFEREAIELVGAFTKAPKHLKQALMSVGSHVEFDHDKVYVCAVRECTRRLKLEAEKQEQDAGTVVSVEAARAAAQIRDRLAAASLVTEEAADWYCFSCNSLVGRAHIEQVLDNGGKSGTCESPILPKESGDPPIPKGLKLAHRLVVAGDLEIRRWNDRTQSWEAFNLSLADLIERLGAAERERDDAREGHAIQEGITRVALSSREKLESKLAAAEQSLAQMHESADWYKQTTREQVAAHDRDVRRKARAEALEEAAVFACSTCKNGGRHRMGGSCRASAIRSLVTQEPPETHTEEELWATKS